MQLLLSEYKKLILSRTLNKLTLTTVYKSVLPRFNKHFCLISLYIYIWKCTILSNCCDIGISNLSEFLFCDIINNIHNWRLFCYQYAFIVIYWFCLSSVFCIVYGETRIILLCFKAYIPLCLHDYCDFERCIFEWFYKI